jgi:hypothetical protein
LFDMVLGHFPGHAAEFLNILRHGPCLSAKPTVPMSFRWRASRLSVSFHRDGFIDGIHYVLSQFVCSLNPQCLMIPLHCIALRDSRPFHFSCHGLSPCRFTRNLVWRFIDSPISLCVLPDRRVPLSYPSPSGVLFALSGSTVRLTSTLLPSSRPWLTGQPARKSLRRPHQQQHKSTFHG